MSFLVSECFSAQEMQPSPPANSIELQPSQTERYEEQGRGFVLTCRLPDHVKGSNLRWTQGANRRPINTVDGRSVRLVRVKLLWTLMWHHVYHLPCDGLSPKKQSIPCSSGIVVKGRGDLSVYSYSLSSFNYPAPE